MPINPSEAFAIPDGRAAIEARIAAVQLSMDAIRAQLEDPERVTYLGKGYKSWQARAKVSLNYMSQEVAFLREELAKLPVVPYEERLRLWEAETEMTEPRLIAGLYESLQGLPTTVAFSDRTRRLMAMCRDYLHSLHKYPRKR